MLYITTRDNQEIYTAQRTLRENRGKEGGFYLPFRFPLLSKEECSRLLEKPFNACVAEVLNRLLNTQLTGWDVDFCIGRYPVRLERVGHRIFLAESWHNPEWKYARLEKNLSAQFCDLQSSPTNWGKIAIRIALLFGIYGEIRRSGVETADISFVSGDFSGPISARYARKWGLPVGNIICCCNENSTLWDLICHGQMRTDVLAVETCIPEADVTLPDNLERLIYECGGTEEVRRYLTACRAGTMYCPTDGILPKLRNGMYVSVVSSHRLETTIPNVYKSHQYLMEHNTALAYAGLQDYRARTGEMRTAVVMADYSPICEADRIADLIGIPADILRKELL